MKINLEFCSYQEMKNFCIDFVTQNVVTTKEILRTENVGVYYPSEKRYMRILQFAYENNFELNKFQWEWIYYFCKNDSLNFSFLVRQCGKTEFLMFLMAYLVKVENMKVSYVSCNHNIQTYVISKICKKYKFTEEQHRNNMNFGIADINFYSLRGQKPDYIILDEKKFFKTDLIFDNSFKEISLSS